MWRGVVGEAGDIVIETYTSDRSLSLLTLKKKKKEKEKNTSSHSIVVIVVVSVSLLLTLSRPLAGLVDWLLVLLVMFTLDVVVSEVV